MCFSLQHRIAIFPFVLNCFYPEFDSLLLKRILFFLTKQWINNIGYFQRVGRYANSFLFFHTGQFLWLHVFSLQYNLRKKETYFEYREENRELCRTQGKYAYKLLNFILFSIHCYVFNHSNKSYADRFPRAYLISSSNFDKNLGFSFCRAIFCVSCRRLPVEGNCASYRARQARI